MPMQLGSVRTRPCTVTWSSGLRALLHCSPVRLWSLHLAQSPSCSLVSVSAANPGAHCVGCGSPSEVRVSCACHQARRWRSRHCSRVRTVRPTRAACHLCKGRASTTRHRHRVSTYGHQPGARHTHRRAHGSSTTLAKSALLRVHVHSTPRGELSLFRRCSYVQSARHSPSRSRDGRERAESARSNADDSPARTKSCVSCATHR